MSRSLATCRGVKTDVGKIEIERDENAILRLRGVKDPRIEVTSQMFVERRMRIVTSLAKPGFSITG